MIVPQPGTDQIIFPHLVELLTSWSRCHGWHSVASVTFRAPPADAWRVVPPLQLHPLRDRCGATLQIQPSAQLGAGWERRWIGASIWIFIHGRRLHLGSAFYGFPRTPWGTFCYLPTPPPAGRASHLESQLMAIRYGLTAPPEPLRLPQPTWTPPATQNRRRAQLPPPPPRTDSVSTTDQSADNGPRYGA